MTERDSVEVKQSIQLMNLQSELYNALDYHSNCNPCMANTSLLLKVNIFYVVQINSNLVNIREATDTTLLITAHFLTLQTVLKDVENPKAKAIIHITFSQPQTEVGKTGQLHAPIRITVIIENGFF